MLIKIGTRGSSLALRQVDEVRALLRKKRLRLDLERVIFETKGDLDKRTPLTQKNVPDDFFTDTLDRALLNKKIDAAVHSAKDLPQKLSGGLEIFAVTKSLDETDAFVGKCRFHRLKAGAKIGTSSVLRARSLKELNPGLNVVEIRGTIEERIRLVERGICDGIIAATIALKRLGLAHLIQDVMPWEATPLQGALAIVGRARDKKLKEIFSALDVRKTYGRVYLVGAGPGAPDLITLRGLEILKEADCIFYDYLTPREILRCAPRAEKIYVGKRKGAHAMPQAELCRRLRQKAMERKLVARLKGGDPLVFGRGADEISYLRSYFIPVEVVPGVSSATGLTSVLGIPLTARGIASSAAFVSGHGAGEKGAKSKPIAVPAADTLVFFMGLTKLREIVGAMRRAGRPLETPVLLISQGTCAGEKIVSGTLADIQKKVKRRPLKPPALIVIGEVVRFFDKTRNQKLKIKNVDF